MIYYFNRIQSEDFEPLTGISLSSKNPSGIRSLSVHCHLPPLAELSDHTNSQQRLLFLYFLQAK